MELYLITAPYIFFLFLWSFPFGLGILSLLMFILIFSVTYSTKSYFGLFISSLLLMGFGLWFIPFAIIKLNFLTFILFLCQWFIIGIVFALIKWFFFLREEGKYIKDNYDELIKDWKEFNIRNVMKKTFQEYLIMCRKISKFSDKYPMFLKWMTFWPIYILGDIPEIIGNFIRKFILKIYNVIRNYAYKSVGLDLTKL